MTESSYLPQTGDSFDLTAFTVKRQPDRTYKLDADRGRALGFTEGADALLQAVYLILNVERYRYPIYSRNYGVELADLIGKPKDFVMSDVKRRIAEALTQDDRVDRVDGFQFENGKDSLTVSFTVHSVYGDILAQKEVAI